MLRILEERFKAIFANNSKLSKMSKRYTAFTLAEVLIVVGIIGIIAEITIPEMISNYQKKVYVTAHKKAYSEFLGALNAVSTSYGCVGDLRCTGINGVQALGDELVKNMKVIKNCKMDANQGCFSNATKSNYDGSGSFANYDSSSSYYRFITADGIGYAIISYDSSCSSVMSSWKDSDGVVHPYFYYCGRLLIDVNGPNKKPNFFGRDLFIYFIQSNPSISLAPFGGNIDPNTGSASGHWAVDGVMYSCYPGNPRGSTCAGRIMEEGWEMNY